MQLEMLYGAQSYIEDCEVCCRGILIHYEVSDDYELEYFCAQTQSE